MWTNAWEKLEEINIFKLEKQNDYISFDKYKLIRNKICNKALYVLIKSICIFFYVTGACDRNWGKMSIRMLMARVDSFA